MYVRFSLSLRDVEDLLHEGSIEISHKTVWFWLHRFGLYFAAESSCATVGPDAGGLGSCPPVVEYSLQFLAKLVKGSDLLPDGSAIAEILADQG